jgi:hypothetical protein
MRDKERKSEEDRSVKEKRKTGTEGSSRKMPCREQRNSSKKKRAPPAGC